MALYFSDQFEVKPELLEESGLYNISLVSDLPLFVDPFLLFDSENDKYLSWHNQVIDYLRFLRDRSLEGRIDLRRLNYWYRFPEVKENWLGFTRIGNTGSGLGYDFARALNDNLARIFKDFGDERITKGSHLEKLCLIKEGVGRDNISDFTTNLIKPFLLELTQEFAIKNIDKKYLSPFVVPRAKFDFKSGVWVRAKYTLPKFNGEFVLLTPKDILTVDEAWINRPDLYEEFENIPPAIPDEDLRQEVSSFFYSHLSKDSKKEDRYKAAAQTIDKYPQLIDYYIKHKEESSTTAHAVSKEKVSTTEEIFNGQLKALALGLEENTSFYNIPTGSYKEALNKVNTFKDYIENNDGYKIIQLATKISRKEEIAQIFFGILFKGSPYSSDREVNNGRGAVDFKISMGSRDSTLIEFKLASNTKLERNLQKQVAIYEKANSTRQSIKVIICFEPPHTDKVNKILNSLGIQGKEGIILIDAREDNKPSASAA